MNIYAIAKLAGVSIATVSRVLNNYPHVAQEKRRRILDILKEHNYVPNAAARSLAVNETRTVGIMLTDIRHTYHANIAYTIEQAMNAAGYIVILCNAGICVKDQTAYLRVLAEKQVDGIIMVGSVFSSKEIAHSIRAHLSQTPIVLHNGFIVADNIYSIRTEPQQGIRQVVDHLYNKNHRRIGFVQDYATWSARLKLSAFRQYMLRHGIQGPYDIVQTVPSLEGGRQAARELFQKNTGITAIMTAGDDLTAIGVIKELQAMGKKVPQDIAVTGHNNSLFAAISHPPLTSVDTKMETVGTLLVQTMIQALRGEKPPRVQKIKPELVIRETT